MSHFVVWVVGDDVEGQLAPFQEHCPEAFTVVPLEELSKELRMLGYAGITKHIAKDLKEKDPVAIVSEGMLYDKEGKVGTVIRELHGCGVTTVLVADEDTGELRVLKRVSHENGKWDWFFIGGRWAGNLILKPNMIPPATAIKGGENNSDFLKRYLAHQGVEELGSDRYDALPKRCIDIEAMEREYLKEHEDVLKIHAIVDGLNFRSYPTIYQELEEETGERPDRATLLERFDNQPAMVALDKAQISLPDFFDESLLKVPADKIRKVLAGHAWQPLAWLKDGDWVERGNMGWFGIVSDPCDYDEWDRYCRETWESIDDDAMITLVDCHV
jgi:8-oxo-dGTP pyrophosphatase MutT (NUDIX family)